MSEHSELLAAAEWYRDQFELLVNEFHNGELPCTSSNAEKFKTSAAAIIRSRLSPRRPRCGGGGMMTPYEITILLHCFTRPGPFAESGISKDAPIFNGTLEELCKQDLIMRADTPCGWKTTNRGTIYIDSLCSICLPQRVWLNAQGEVKE